MADNKIRILIEAEVRKALENMKDIEKQTKKNEKSVSLLSKAFKILGGAFIAKKVVDGLTAITKQAADFEQLNVAFTTFLGSADKAKVILKELEQFSVVTPFTINQVNSAAKTLLSFGVEADKVTDTLKIIGDVSAGTGKDLREMAVIFGQIRSTGKLMGQDLLQLINAGFNPLQQISKDTGKSVAQLKDEMSKGLISFDQVEQAFRNATSEGGLFFDLMNKQSRTFSGRISTLQGNISLLGQRLGATLLPILGEFVDALDELVKSEETVEALTVGFKSLVSVMLVLKNVAVAVFNSVQTFLIDPLINSVAELTKIWKAFTQEGLLGAAKQAAQASVNFIDQTKESFVTNGNDIITSTKKTVKEVSNLWKETGKAVINNEIQIAQQREEIARESNIKIIENEQQKRKMLQQFLLQDRDFALEQERIKQEEILLIAEEFGEKRAEVESIIAERRIQRETSNATRSLQIANDLFNSINTIVESSSSIRLSKIDKERQALEDQKAQGLITEEQFAKKKEELDAKEKKEKNKAAKAAKTAAIIQSIISTALAAINAFASGAQINPFLGIAMAAVATAAGVAATAAIAAQPVPQFQAGTDFAPGGTALVGEAGPELVNLPRGSQVIPNDVTRQLLDDGGGPSIVNNEENLDNRTINIRVEASDPLVFANKLKRQHGIKVFT